MWEYRYRRYGGPEVLERIESEEQPTPGAGEVVVRVHAIGVNPVDWKLARGDFRLLTGFRPDRTPGQDYSGVIESMGPGVHGLSIGQRVFGMMPLLGSSGSYAAYVRVRARHLAAVPDGFSMTDAAAIPLAALTAFRALFLHGRIAPGADVLVHGASGGVGSFAVQLAVIGRARVTAVSSARNTDYCRELGAIYTLDYAESDPLQEGNLYDFIFDVAGNLEHGRAIACLRNHGVLVSLQPDFVSIIRSMLPRRDGKRYHLELVRPDGRRLHRIAEHAAAGRLTAPIEQVYSIDQIENAWRRSMTGHVQGKIVITV
ncbi:MAG: NAD(P)-dependent alcohol dehydrogenase [Spirochaetaceae bacterium]